MFEYIKDFFMFITDWISSLGYIGVFAGMTLESACIPLPSEIILPFTGYLIHEGRLNLWWAVLWGTLGNLVGGWIAYFIGLYGGKPFILKYGKYFFVSPRRFHQAEDLFNRYGNKIIFISRMLPIIRTFISLPAGIAGMSFRKFSLYTFAGSLPWSLLWIYLGMKLGKHWEELGAVFQKLDLTVIIGAVLVVLYFVAKRKKWIKF